MATVRGAFDGPSYQWGLFGLGGRGVGGDYWFPFLGASIALAVVAGGWRNRRWAFNTIAAWSVLVFAVVVAAVASSPTDFRFRGDTLGIDVSLAVVGPVLFGTSALLSQVAAWRVHLRRQVAAVEWQTRNWRWLTALVGALPFQFALLRLGGPDSLSDQIGVVITIVQWFMVGRVFRSHAA